MLKRVPVTRGAGYKREGVKKEGLKEANRIEQKGIYRYIRLLRGGGGEDIYERVGMLPYLMAIKRYTQEDGVGLVPNLMASVLNAIYERVSE